MPKISPTSLPLEDLDFYVFIIVVVVVFEGTGRFRKALATLPSVVLVF